MVSENLRLCKNFYWWHGMADDSENEDESYGESWLVIPSAR